MLNGWKTYVVAGVTVAYALTEWLLVGAIDQTAAFAMIFGAGGLAALRNGIANK